MEFQFLNKIRWKTQAKVSLVKNVLHSAVWQVVEDLKPTAYQAATPGNEEKQCNITNIPTLLQRSA